MEYLNDIEKDAVQNFLSNLTMKEAVRKVLLSGVYFEGTLVEGQPAHATKNFLLGTMQNSAGLSALERAAKMDALINAVLLVERGFDTLEKMKKIEIHQPEIIKNPGR